MKNMWKDDGTPLLCRMKWNNYRMKESQRLEKMGGCCEGGE